LKRNYFPYLARNQYKQEEKMQLIAHNLQPFSISNTKYNTILLPILPSSPYFLLPDYLENDDNDNANDSPFSFSKDK
jgi:hypothetical protein